MNKQARLLGYIGLRVRVRARLCMEFAALVEGEVRGMWTRAKTHHRIPEHHR